jgi:hypothetical protein
MAVSEKSLLLLLRDVVSARASGRCEFPGCQKTDADPHHAGGRGNAVLFDPDTCINLCACHHTSGATSAHGTPEAFKAAIINTKVRPYDWFDGVRFKANQVVKDTAEFRAEWKERLLNELRRAAA